MLKQSQSALPPSSPAEEPRVLRDYRRMTRAINYLAQHQQSQPSLNAVAAHLHLSPYHFQRLFARWVGLSPKRFLQALTVEQAKNHLQSTGSLLSISEQLGLSSSSRLYDHFVQLEAMTPAQFRAQGKGVQIRYGLHATVFGWAFIAATERGICKLSFFDQAQDGHLGLQELQRQWPGAVVSADQAHTARLIEQVLASAADRRGPLSLHVIGSNFQIQVWRCLLELAPAQGASYGQIAHAIARPGAARAVGSAVGANPVALIIPCHRVIRQSGALGDYRWGRERKRALQFWEWLQAQGKNASA